VWATPKTYELFALPQSEEINLDSFLAVVHPEDRSLVSRIITEAMQSGEEPAVEYRVVRPNGDVHWIASRGRTDDNQTAIGSRSGRDQVGTTAGWADSPAGAYRSAS